MARVKKTEAAPPPPKHWREIKHGCCSCKFYKEEPKNFPCRPCTDWNYWEDAKPERTIPLQAISHNISDDLTGVPQQVETALEQNTDTSKVAKRRARKTEIVTEDAVPKQEELAVEPKKRPGRPKKVTEVSEVITTNPESSVTKPKNKVGRPKKSAVELQAQAAPFDDTEQLCFGL